MRRGALLAGLAALALPASAVASAEEPLLTLCMERTARDLAAAAVLDGWMNAIRIEVAEPPCAPPRESHFVGRFEMRGRSVYFRLAGASGPALGRALPWLDRLDEPLASLDAAGWLGEFSVVLEALLAEHHLALEWAELFEAELAQANAGRADGAAAAKKGAKSPGGKGARDRGGADVGRAAGDRRNATVNKAGDVREGMAAGTTGAVRGGTGQAGGDRGESASAAGGADVAKAVAGAADPAETGGEGDGQGSPAGQRPTDAGATTAPPAPSGDGAPADRAAVGSTADGTAPGDPSLEGERPPADRAVADAGDAPRLPGIEEEARAAAARRAAAREARRNAIDFRTPDAAPLPLGIRAGGALRLRSPDVAAPEISIGVEVGSVYARGAWQPEVRWHLAGLPIAVEGIGAEAGLHFPLLSGRIWSIRGHAGLALERLVLQPLYREDAAEQVDWDAGPTAGANLAWRLGPDLQVGLAGGLHWMPTARLTHIGELGPSTRLNAFGGRLGVDFSWQR